MILNSLLFVPAKKKTLKKLGELGADAYIVDLEDSIEKENKRQALSYTVDCLQNDEWDHSNIKLYIRLNKTNYVNEAKALDRFDFVGFMLPKFEDVKEYEECISIWIRHSVIALIETPKAIISLKNIAGCEWVDSLAFGAEDYTATVCMENNYNRLYYQKNAIVTYSKAFGKKVYDSPCFELKKDNIIKDEVQDSIEIGFDGKLAIHPKQVDIINHSFKTVNIDFIKNIVEKYESCGQAVLVIDGRPYEKMHINRFKRIIKENGGEI